MLKMFIRPATSSVVASSMGYIVRLSSLSCRNECLKFALGEETAAQTVVDSIV